MHEHEFASHVGVRLFGGTVRAWLPESKVENIGAFKNVETYPRMFMCTGCGEQGYEIRDARQIAGRDDV